MPEEEIASAYSYDLFISYSTDPDYEAARKIESFLESFNKLIPATTPLRLKSLAVCRDGSDFSIHALTKKQGKDQDKDDVTSTLISYLQQSAYLLVLCSANAARSRYVQFETNWFIENRGADRVLLAVTEGNNPREDPSTWFSAPIIEHHLEEKIYYDLRGLRKASRHWQKVRDYEEELISLAALLNNESGGILYPLWKRQERKRQRKIRYLISAGALICLVLAVVALIQRNTAVAQRNYLQEQLVRNYWANSKIARNSNNRLGSLLYIGAALSVSKSTNLSRNLSLDAQPDLPLITLKQVFPQSSAVYSAAFSPDGRTILTVSADSIARCWDATSGQPKGTPLKSKSGILKAVFSNDGTRIASMGLSDTVFIWEAATHTPINYAVGSGQLTSIAFSPDGKKIVAATVYGIILVWDVKTGKLLNQTRIVQENEFTLNVISTIAISKDGKQVLTSFFMDGNAKRWEMATGKQIGPELEHDAIYSACFSPDGKLMATAGLDSVLRVWKTNAASSLNYQVKQAGGINKAQFSPDGKLLVTAGRDNTARLWEVATGKPTRLALQHEGIVLDAAFSPDGKWLATASADNSARLWDVATGIQYGPSMLHQGVQSVQFSPAGDMLLTTGQDKTTRLWQIRPLVPIQSVQQLPGNVIPFQLDKITAMFDDDRQSIYTLNNDNTIGLLNVSSLAPRFSAMDNGEEITAIRVAAGSKYLITNGNKSVHIWNSETGKEITAAIHPERRIQSAATDADGKNIYVLNLNQFIEKFHVETGEKEYWTIRHERPGKSYFDPFKIYSFDISPDGRFLLTTGEDSTARLWSTRDGKQIGVPMRHRSVVYGSLFSPDGKVILTYSADKTACLWKTGTGHLAFPPLQHAAPVMMAFFSKSGRKLLTLDNDETMRCWDTESGLQIGPSASHTMPLAALSTNEDILVAESSDSTVRLIELATGRQVGPNMVHSLAMAYDASFDNDETAVMTLDRNHNLHTWKIGSDLDLPPALFNLQASVLTGARLNPQTNEVNSIAAAEWIQLTKEYLLEAKQHYAVCLYKKYNAWAHYYK